MFKPHFITRKTVQLPCRYSSQLAHPTTQAKRKTISSIQKLHDSKTKISMVTAHDYITGSFANDANADIVLVGDSLAMVALGYDNTTKLEFDEFLYCVRSVSRAVTNSLLIADLPFGSFESSVQQGVESAMKLVKYGNVQAIKIEGCEEHLPLIKRLTEIGIPVMGHSGLTPQKVNSLSGFKTQGKTVESATQLLQDCLTLQKNGCFSVLLEAIPYKLAQHVSSRLSVPTIGIGAGPHVSGQVLVMADLLGMNRPMANNPKFLKRYSNVYDQAVESIQNYKSDLQTGNFPLVDEHSYGMNDVIWEKYLESAKDI